MLQLSDLNLTPEQERELRAYLFECVEEALRDASGYKTIEEVTAQYSIVSLFFKRLFI